MRPALICLLTSITVALAGCPGGGSATVSAPGRPRLRVGHFPNLTHAQALVAHGLTRQGKGWFEARLDADLEWFVYNAGPSAMEGLFSEALDVTYVGPSPALNAYARSRGEEVRVVAGSAAGGSALVVRATAAAELRRPEDFRGRRVCTPQLGNTQDVSCRAWCAEGGLTVTTTGGDVLVLPTENPELPGLFQQGEVDAAWTVEPWVTRLELETGARVLVEEREALTTVVVARAAFLEERRDLVRRFVAAHAELTRWMAEHPAEARQLVADELKAETTRAIPAEVLDRAWARLTFTTELPAGAFSAFVAKAQKVGFLRDAPDVGALVEAP